MKKKNPFLNAENIFPDFNSKTAEKLFFPSQFFVFKWLFFFSSCLKIDRKLLFGIDCFWEGCYSRRCLMLQKPLWNYIHKYRCSNKPHRPQQSLEVHQGRCISMFSLRQQNLASTCSITANISLNWLNSIKGINDLCYRAGIKSPSSFLIGRMAFLQEIQVILEEKPQLHRIPYLP